MSGTDLPLHVELAGHAPGADVPTFVLVHGYGASSFTWRHWTPRLARLGHVVQVDLKGFGRAPKPDDDRYAPGDLAGLVVDLIEARDLGDVTLLGHSLGGGIALLAALRLLADRPSRLRRLVLVAGAAYEQRLPPFVTLARYPRLTTLLVRLVGARLVVAVALRSVVYDATTVDEAQIRGYAEPLGSPEATRALLASARQIVPPDLAELARRYPEVSVPTLLLWGSHDRVVPLATGRRLAAALPDARLHVVERCGHLPAEERPEASWRLLARFLADTAGAGQAPSRPHRSPSDPPVGR